MIEQTLEFILMQDLLYFEFVAVGFRVEAVEGVFYLIFYFLLFLVEAVVGDFFFFEEVGGLGGLALDDLFFEDVSQVLDFLGVLLFFFEF